MGKYSVIMVLALSFWVMTYSLSLKNSDYDSHNRIVQSYSQNQAYNIAQSVLTVAVKDIMKNGKESQVLVTSNSEEFQRWEDLDGYYNLQVRNLGDTLMLIESTGMYDGRTYTTRTGYSYESGSLTIPPVAVHSGTSIELTGSSKIDGDASTNATDPNSVVLSGSTLIDGTLAIGHGGEPDEVVNQASGSKVESGIYNLENELNYPMPEFPIPEQNSGNRNSVIVEGNQTRSLHHTEFDGYYIPELKVASNRELTIQVGDEDRKLHVGSFNVPQGHVNLEGEGSLEIYVQDNLVIGGGSRVNDGGDVNDVFFYYSGQDAISLAGNTYVIAGFFAEKANVSLGGSNALRGSLITGGSLVTIVGDAEAVSRVVYAPNATVHLKGSGRVTGSIVADIFIGEGNIIVDHEDPDSEIPEFGEEEPNMVYWD